MEAIVDRAVPSVDPASVSKARRRTGIVLSSLAVAFLLFDAVMKIAKAEPVLEATQKLGYPESTARPLGIVLLGCVALYVVRRTAVLGAALLTAFLGGAIATHVRVEDPLFSHTLFPIYVAAFVWGGLYLRDARLRSIAPWNR
jgi:hypothetical protein